MHHIALLADKNDIEETAMIKKLYPGGKGKAFNITYDDGVLQDIRFVELINKYNIKGTFNLNSQLMEQQFEWTHPNGMAVKRLPENIVVDLYNGHEVASHTLTHPYMSDMVYGEIMRQLGRDKASLEQLFGAKVAGFAVPFDYYSPQIAQCAKKCGFEYARMSQESLCYTPSEDYYWWQCGIFHLNPNLDSFVEGFLKTKEELALCQIVGHSYDLDAEDMWDKMENIVARIAADRDVVSMTNIELVRYLKAIRSADISGNAITNYSDMELWFSVKGSVVSVKPKEIYSF